MKDTNIYPFFFFDFFIHPSKYLVDVWIENDLLTLDLF